MVNLALLLNPSTAPVEIMPLARNQFSKRGRWVRKDLAVFFIGSIFERIVRVHLSLVPTENSIWHRIQR